MEEKELDGNAKRNDEGTTDCFDGKHKCFVGIEGA